MATVLHIEDDPNDLLLLQTAFQKSGLRVCVKNAKSGEEALDYLHNSLMQRPHHPFPDLVLLDLKLPVMGGLSTLGAIRADERLRKLPVYILTDWDSPDARSQARASGAAGFFAKALDFTDVIAAVSLLSSPGADQSA